MNHHRCQFKDSEEMLFSFSCILASESFNAIRFSDLMHSCEFWSPDRRIEIAREYPLRDIMRANNDIAPVWPHAASIRIPGQGFAHV